MATGRLGDASSRPYDRGSESAPTLSDRTLADKGIPTSRYRRLAKVGRAAASQAVKQAGTRAANVARSEERASAALERRHIETAEQIVAVLGTMKGAAMKLGQVLSFLDVGLVPPEYREEFQRKLAELRDSAPTVAFKDMRRVVEDDLSGSLDEFFADFDEEPIAAASIGQVYRARLHDGRDVAVKVQYPGVNAAVRADMQNLGVILRLVGRITPRLDTKAVGQEIRARIVDELDYELEASNQRTLARIFRGHPFILVPNVVTSLSRERVIVTEFIDGTGFEALKLEPQDERDRLGEIVFRFYFGCMYRHRRFSGDPHPGNMLRLADGRVAFLDFGLFKQLDDAAVELELACQRAVVEGDAVELHRLLGENGFLPEPDRLTPDRLLAYVLDGVWWYTSDEAVELSQEIAARALLEAGDPRSSHFEAVRHQDIKPDHVIGRRLEMLTLAVLGQLGARNNWHRIAREWMYRDAPVTELGRQEAEFLAARRRS
jgi:predicted unusual protein kinase regulating ubiquinone biosynthesis (AarF/ABC1/UbiB family)